MGASARERMRGWRDRQRSAGRREVRMVLPDARLAKVRERVAASVASLDPQEEDAALRWIEAVSDFDDDSPR